MVADLLVLSPSCQPNPLHSTGSRDSIRFVSTRSSTKFHPSLHTLHACHGSSRVKSSQNKNSAKARRWRTPTRYTVNNTDRPLLNPLLGSSVLKIRLSLTFLFLFHSLRLPFSDFRIFLRLTNELELNGPPAAKAKAKAKANANAKGQSVFDYESVAKENLSSSSEAATPATMGSDFSPDRDLSTPTPALTSASTSLEETFRSSPVQI